MSISDTNEVTKYSDEDLKEFEVIINNKLAIAKEQLDFYITQLKDMAESPESKIKGIDDGLNTVETERLYTMANRQKSLIEHLENAKLRIKNKVYGICRQTGKLISKERLKAVPHATLSIEAKQGK